MSPSHWPLTRSSFPPDLSDSEEMEDPRLNVSARFRSANGSASLRLANGVIVPLRRCGPSEFMIEGNLQIELCPAPLRDIEGNTKPKPLVKIPFRETVTQITPAKKSSTGTPSLDCKSATQVITPEPAADKAIVDSQYDKLGPKPCPSGVEPDYSKKLFCTHWIRTGECDFVQQGCRFKHEMPALSGLKPLGFRDFPAWWKQRKVVKPRKNTLRQSKSTNGSDDEGGNAMEHTRDISRELNQIVARGYDFNKTVDELRNENVKNNPTSQVDRKAHDKTPRVEEVNLIDLDIPMPGPTIACSNTPGQDSISTGEHHTSAGSPNADRDSSYTSIDAPMSALQISSSPKATKQPAITTTTGPKSFHCDPADEQIRYFFTDHADRTDRTKHIEAPAPKSKVTKRPPPKNHRVRPSRRAARKTAGVKNDEGSAKSPPKQRTLPDDILSAIRRAKAPALLSSDLCKEIDMAGSTDVRAPRVDSIRFRVSDAATGSLSIGNSAAGQSLKSVKTLTSSKWAVGAGQAQTKGSP